MTLFDRALNKIRERGEPVDILTERQRWGEWQLDGMDPSTAITIFDISRDVPKRAAVMMLQNAMLACGEQIKVDGIFGEKTRAVIDRATRHMPLITAMRSEKAAYLRSTFAHFYCAAVNSTITQTYT